jgi:hypothetical protein
MKRVVASVTNVASPISTEGVVATLPAAPLPADAGGVLASHNLIDGFINFTAGTGTTAVVLRVRRGSLTGALVGPAQTNVQAAGVIASIAFSADDSAAGANPPPIGQVYVVTIAQTGGTAAGNTNYAVATLTVS